jgi:small GTP-binding protein
MQNAKYFRRKICLIGDAAVGKTSLIRKYVEDRFDDKYIVTLGTKVTVKEVSVKRNADDKAVCVTLMIWDILGQREFKRLQTSYYRGANGGLIVADITRKETLKNTHDWILSLFNNVGKVPLILLLNKSDRKNQTTITSKEIEDVISKWNIPYMYTSAKTGENVEKAFKKIGEMLLEKHGKNSDHTMEPGLKNKTPSADTANIVPPKNKA